MISYQGTSMNLKEVEPQLLSAPSSCADTNTTQIVRSQWSNSRHAWERYRPLITTLYIDFKMPLTNLMEFMQGRYRFKATRRMYKARFKEWEIYRYPRVVARHRRDESPIEIEARGDFKSHTSVMNRSSKTPGVRNYNAGAEPSESYEPESRCFDPSICLHRHCVRSLVSKWSWEQLQWEGFPSTSWPFGAFTVHQRSTSGRVEEILYYVQEFSQWWVEHDSDNHADPIISKEAARLTAFIDGHCAHHASPDLCERCTWTEIEYGLAMMEMGERERAFESFELGCRLIQLLLIHPSKYFIRNLFMALGSNRWENFEPIRQSLLAFIAGMADLSLGPTHPITIILLNAACGDTLKRSAEFSLKMMIEIFEKSTNAAHPDVLLVKRSLSLVLRRQEEFETSEEILLSAINASIALNGAPHKETRRCLRRLAHLYMQRNWWTKAEDVCIRIIDRAWEDTESERSIPDEISVYTYQHLAVIANSMGDHDKCRMWFSKELEAAILRWGPKVEYSAECIRAALLQDKQSFAALTVEVNNFPEGFGQACGKEMQSQFIISKARWCAIRNLI